MLEWLNIETLETLETPEQPSRLKADMMHMRGWVMCTPLYAPEYTVLPIKSMVHRCD